MNRRAWVQSEGSVAAFPACLSALMASLLLCSSCARNVNDPRILFEEYNVYSAALSPDQYLIVSEESEPVVFPGNDLESTVRSVGRWAGLDQGLLDSFIAANHVAKRLQNSFTLVGPGSVVTVPSDEVHAARTAQVPPARWRRDFGPRFVDGLNTANIAFLSAVGFDSSGRHALVSRWKQVVGQTAPCWSEASYIVLEKHADIWSIRAEVPTWKSTGIWGDAEMARGALDAVEEQLLESGYARWREGPFRALEFWRDTQAIRWVEPLGPFKKASSIRIPRVERTLQ